MRRVSSASVTFLLLLLPSIAAAVPGYIQYSGRVTDGATASGTTTANLRVKLYTCACAHGDATCADATNQCAEGDDGLFFEGHHGDVTLVDGYFTVLIGYYDAAGAAFPDPGASALSAKLPLPEALWMTVSVNGDPELAPRQRVASVPYALNAASATRNEIVSGGRHYAVNAVFKGTTRQSVEVGTLSAQHGGSFDAAGNTAGLIRFPHENGVLLTGYAAAKRACEVALGSSSAHMCTVQDMVVSAQMGINSGVIAWVSHGTTSYKSNGSIVDRDCYAWTSKYTCAEHSDCHGSAWKQSMTEAYCADAWPISCCDHP